MSGRGETPGKDGDEEATDEAESVGFGTEVYNADGTLLGTVRGIESGGFFVSTRDGVENLSIEHSRSGHEFGEAELMWRCTKCGEMGEIDEGLPETCPNCGVEKEALMYWTED